MSETQQTSDNQYAKDAYLACLHGRADDNQQRSAAAQIALLRGDRAELLACCREALEDLGDFADRLDPGERRLEELERHRTLLRTAIAKAEGR